MKQLRPAMKKKLVRAAWAKGPLRRNSESRIMCVAACFLHVVEWPPP